MLEAMNLAILIGSVLVVVAVFTSLLSFRLGAPLLLVFLAIGLGAGEDGLLGLSFDNAGAAYFIGSLALALILFDSGFETRAATLRGAATQAVVLATVGVLVTAGIVAAAARFMFGFSWLEGLLIGSIVGSTDAAAVFFLLRVGGISLRERVRATLEVESGSNDPMAIFMTMALVQIIAAGNSEANALLDFVSQFLLQIGLGFVAGIAGGFLIVQIINRSTFEPGLYPILLLALALALFAVTAMLGGSGFLAVYVAGIIAGNSEMRHKTAFRRFNNGITWLAQIAMFLILGLLATPSTFPLVAGPAIGLALVLMLFARPIAVWLCLLPFGFSRYEIAFTAWVGLRGAVSILLAILPILTGLANGEAIFNIAFMVVLASLLIQGWSIRPVARWLGLIVPPRLGPVERIELELPGGGNHEIVAYRVHPDSPVAKGERIPRWARPSLILRDGRSLKPHSFGRPLPGDRIYIVTVPAYVGILDRLFAGAAAGAANPDLYGEFAIDVEAALGDLAAVYGAQIEAGQAELSVGDFLRHELSGDIEQGDRVSLGPVDLIVRRVGDDHGILEVGLSVEPTTLARPRLPVFQGRKEIAAWTRRWQERRRTSLRAGPGVVARPSVDPTTLPENGADAGDPGSDRR